MTPRRRARTGFTLVELLIVITMLSIVMLATSKIVLVVQRDFVAQRGMAAADDRIQNAEAIIQRVLRGARANPNGVVGLASIHPDPLAHGSLDNIRVRSDFNPADSDVNDPLEDVSLYVSNDTMYVRWQAGAAAQPVAFPVRSLAFEYRKLDNTVVTTAAALDSTVKRVKYEITVPRDAASARSTTILVRRQGWVFLRN
jgi:prepilin-type N-terminal cleavage/methylation domain-containing protein